MSDVSDVVVSGGGQVGLAPRTKPAHQSKGADQRFRTSPEGPTRIGRQVYDTHGE